MGKGKEVRDEEKKGRGEMEVGQGRGVWWRGLKKMRMVNERWEERKRGWDKNKGERRRESETKNETWLKGRKEIRLKIYCPLKRKEISLASPVFKSVAQGG